MEHFYFGIPGFFHATNLYSQMVRKARDGSRFVEVGAWLGQSTAYLAVEIINSGKDIKLDVIDLWPDEYGDRMIDAWVAEHGNAMPHFIMNMQPVIDKLDLTIHKLDSVHGARLFPDQSLDFVYIDADHSEQAVRADLAAWQPKVKLGGTLAGDDFSMEGVYRAVSDHCAGREIESMMEGNISWVVPV